MKIILGLGNPGVEYANTLHNAGFMVLDELARTLGAEWRESHWQALASEVTRNTGERVILLKPQTFMNCSGDALTALCDALDGGPDGADILVVVDDIHLPPGQMRFRARGSAGGHNGLASIETALASSEYGRLRIGVGGADAPDRIAHVLGAIDEADAAIFAATVQVAATAVRVWLDEGMLTCQERYNGRIVTDGVGDGRDSTDDER